jgi:hypothetical protein
VPVVAGLDHDVARRPVAQVPAHLRARTEDTAAIDNSARRNRERAFCAVTGDALGNGNGLASDLESIEIKSLREQRAFPFVEQVTGRRVNDLRCAVQYQRTLRASGSLDIRAIRNALRRE